jgi:hypothetical protein
MIIDLLKENTMLRNYVTLFALSVLLSFLALVLFAAVISPELFEITAVELLGALS